MHFYDVTGRKPSLDTARLLNYSHRLTRYTAFNKIAKLYVRLVRFGVGNGKNI